MLYYMLFQSRISHFIIVSTCSGHRLQHARQTHGAPRRKPAVRAHEVGQKERVWCPPFRRSRDVSNRG